MMPPSRKLFLVALGISFVLVTQTEALTFNFSGFITSVANGFSPPIFSPSLVGTAFTATITVTDGFAPPNPNPGGPTSFYLGLYGQPPSYTEPVAFSITLANGFTIRDYTATGTNVVITNSSAGDRLTISAESNFDGGNSILAFNFFDSTGRALSSTDWTTNYNSPFWNSVTVSFGSEVGNRYSFTGAVPDTGGNVLLLTIGLAGLLVFGMRARQA